MTSAPASAPPWPKGPFPEKYRWPACAARLEGAWARDGANEALALATARGLAPHPTWDDPHVRLFVGPGARAARDALATHTPALGVFAFEWWPGAHDLRHAAPDDGVLGLVPSADPLDALLAVGVASPARGLGGATLVRFVIALRGFAAASLTGLGEDRLRLALAPRSEAAAEAIVRRALELAPAALGPDADVARAVASIWPSGDLELRLG